MKVCVIGAGPAGLTTIKQLRDEGHEVVCFEKNANIGGIWYRHGGDEDEMKVYDGLILTISRKLMGFSDFMVPGPRRFFDYKGYLEYLEQYADKYKLRDVIKFNTTVEQVRKIGNEWRVTVSSHRETSEHTFGAVAVCSGPFRTPDKDVSHLDQFKGEVIHSSRYRNNEKFRNKKVLVVGLAESGADLLREISDVSARCTLSIRSRSFLLPRLFSGKYSTDMLTCRAHHHEIWLRSTDVPFPMSAIFEDEKYSRSQFLEASRVYGTMLLAERAVQATSEKPRTDEGSDALNNLGQPLWPLKLDLFTEQSQEVIDFIHEWNSKSHNDTGCWSPKIIFSKNVSFVPNVLNGKIRVDDTGIADIRGNSVHFKDGKVEDFDVIVLCTGFKHDFSLLGDAAVPGNNVRNLYKHAFHPDHGGRLALIGYVRPFSGGIPICAEMQARYFALLCSGKLQLPADVTMRIENEKKWEETWTEYSPRHFEAIPSQLFFCDSIAREIGCLPKVSELLEDPALFNKLWFHSFNQASYRLVGPHAMREEAYKEIMSEEVPARDPVFIAMMMTASVLPRELHPKDQSIDFPLRLTPEEADGVVQTLTKTALSTVKVF